MSVRLPLSAYPGMNRFVLDWLGGDERFLRRHSLPASAARKAQPDAALAAALVESNRRWGIEVADALGRWQSGGTLTVIAGQQVGFAGGPLYTIVKLATLIRLKRDLEAEGISVTPFFWLATEDHDFDEVASLHVPVLTISARKEINRQCDLHCIRVRRRSDSRATVGAEPVPESLITELLELYDHPRPAWLREGITFRESFAELVREVCGNEIILVDSLLPELRRAGASLFEQIAERTDEIQGLLAQRAAALEAAGYDEQVTARDGDSYTLLFEIDDDGTRKPARHPRSPERTSTSALTRPLLQDQVLGTDIFIGGPAEVAYYAQISPLYDLLGVGMPRVALRGHLLVATQRSMQAMQRYGVQPEELFGSPDDIAARREPQRVAAIERIATEGKDDLMEHIRAIREVALPADRSLASSIDRSIRHLEYHFAKLAERARRSVARRDHERHRALRKLVSTLFPDGKVQDRVAAWFPWWCQYGQHFVDRLIEEVEPDRESFRIVEL